MERMSGTIPSLETPALLEQHGWFVGLLGINVRTDFSWHLGLAWRAVREG